MTALQWTPDQERAIATRGSHLLVSAAAGSGKTAVLVERIIRRITEEGDDIDRLLVVTFTDAAAGQMRTRIMQAVDDNLQANPGDEHLLRQLMLLPRASIQTLHSFCLTIVRQHFYKLGLDPNFRILDEQEAHLLRLEVLDDVLENAYDAMNPGDAFSRLVRAYGGARGDETLQQLMLRLHDYARSLPDPHGWLEAAGEAYFSLDAATFDETKWADELQRMAQMTLQRALRSLRQGLSLANGPGGSAAHAESLTDDIDRLTRLHAAAVDGWSRLAALADEAPFPRLKSARGEETDADVVAATRKLRDEAKKLVETMHGKFFGRSLADEMEKARAIAPEIQALLRQVVALDEAFGAAKAARGGVDFGDIEHLCLQLLADDAVADEVRNRFDEVLVDECQDLNGVQDAILARISHPADEGGDVFFVGDVKQSIYRFRQADPGLFLQKYEDAAVDEGAPTQRIDLQKNFRSRSNIVHAVNFLFRQTMTPGAGEMAYSRDVELVFGAGFGADVDDAPVEFHVVEQDGKLLQAAVPDVVGDEADGAHVADILGMSTFERECTLVAHRIRRLIDEGTMVWDGRAEAYRPATYGDVVVLLRAVRHRANELVDVLARADIPAYAELGTGFFAATEIDTMLSLLAVLDNPRQDIELAAVLRSPVGGLEAADLATIRTLSAGGDFYDAVVAAAAAAEQPLRGALRKFLRRLDAWRTLARRRPLSEVVWTLLAETKYFAYAGAMPGGRQRQANLRALHHRARQFDTFQRHGLSRFLEFVRRLQAVDSDLGTAPAVGEADDVVRIMSVHNSKGLEFPIVIVMAVGRDFHGRTGRSDIAFQRKLGIGARFVHDEWRVSEPSLLHEAVVHRQRAEQLAEEMRVLYVALTRAKERLIIVGSARNLERRIGDWIGVLSWDDWSLADERLLSAAGWLDWIGPAVLRHRAGAPLRRVAGLGPAEELRPSAVADDDSLWDVHVWTAADVLRWEPVETSPSSTPVPWEAVAVVSAEQTGPAAEGDDTNVKAPAGDDEPATAARPVDDALVALERRIAWRYERDDVVGYAAKLSVSELKRRWDVAAEGESTPVLPFRRRLDDRPTFLQTGERGLTPAERGSAMHLVLQHIDLTRSLDGEDVAHQIASFVERGLLAPEQAAAVSVDELVRFFATPLGQTLRREAAAVRRELPFTMALPAAEAYGELDPGAAAEEIVIVQGVIDLLLPTATGMAVIDFKTDDIRPAHVDVAAARYENQVKLYRRAVKEMYDVDDVETYVVFLTVGRVVQV